MNWKDYFIYEQSSGCLIWKTREVKSLFDKKFNKLSAGNCAGTKGYIKSGALKKPRGIVIGLMGKDYYAHRIAWEMLNGPIPGGMVIDHINGNPFDNSAINLRLATREQNYHNQGLSQRNTSGVKGVHFDKRRGRWRAEIRSYNNVISLGRFDTLEEAAKARMDAALKYHGKFARA